MADEHEALVLAKKLRFDLTSCQAKLSDLLRMLASMDLPEPSQRECPTCHAVFPGGLSLSEHDYLSHGGPDPEHWLEAERLSDEAA